MKIGELAARTGVSVRMLRYYEEQGILEPHRRESGYRDYGEGDLKLIEMVKRLQAAGLTLAAILELMPCMVENRMTIERCPKVIETLTAAQERLRRKIAQLSLSEASLDEGVRTVGDPLPEPRLPTASALSFR